MSNQLIVVFSGKKRSGKSTAAKATLAAYLNYKRGDGVIELDDEGNITNGRNKEVINLDKVPSALESMWSVFGCKIYSFADPLKEFCINVLGLSERCCYGTDKEKNALTHIRWDSVPEYIRKKYAKGKKDEATGRMRAREIMQVFGTDMCRMMDENCWARATYAKIAQEQYPLAIIADARFPNEVTMGTERGAKVIRLTRNIYGSKDQHPSETALDDFPLGEFSLVLDNSVLSMEQKHSRLADSLHKWFHEAGV